MTKPELAIHIYTETKELDYTVITYIHELLEEETIELYKFCKKNHFPVSFEMSELLNRENNEYEHYVTLIIGTLQGNRVYALGASYIKKTKAQNLYHRLFVLQNQLS